MTTAVSKIFSQAADLKLKLSQDAAFMKAVHQAAELLADTAKSGGTIYACGNGGSACDAAHLVEELVARYKRERPGIRAMHFMDPATLTCWANDYAFDGVFERQAKTFCRPGDCLVAISTSGKSKNIMAAVAAAKAQGAKVIGLTGKDGGLLLQEAQLGLCVPSQETERIQEVHICIIHAWCELLETELKIC